MKRSSLKPARFPKLLSHWERSEQERYGYAFNEDQTDPVRLEWATNSANTTVAEKIHGTSGAVTVVDGEVRHAWTRHGKNGMNRVKTYTEDKTYQKLFRGVQNTMRKGWIREIDGHHYGEFVGPGIQGNPYDLDEHLFVPFYWLRNNCRYTAWGDHGTDYESVKHWLKKEIFSLFHQRIHGGSLQENSVENHVFVEGVVIYHDEAETLVRFGEAPNPETFSKVRRDMFPKDDEDEWLGPLHEH